MMREWATVISWRQGEALLQCEAHAGCSGCRARQGCGSAALAELGPQTRHQLRLAVSQPLQPGQRVEIGLQEASVLRSALLVYITPLVGLLGGGSAGQLWLGSDGASALCALAGGVLGFTLARRWARRMAQGEAYQPVLLQVALPSSQLRSITNPPNRE
ncbi:SoxR-reducing system protein RseC [Edwardsiella piscicida]|uniref:SoxR-reducing system protein RseC n=1 Tax=Edwardsiella piscicida TaxID=1263550 RepID=UPI00084C0608|nr:SoxR-reducing system protein RseC [Edwardsiella piscicida]AOP43968.1 SoxR-reducing system protein RseC [Edwardsiella piscicida]EKS7766327.1 SoxR-reducing system protein RseC [Edwardsiella piscicida]EKS7793033.1 SoxR-reducing system protein RseC [Edwardsiella piscicida]ELM3730304.1 SoxR-reducing system protein RseC [Edwardsiella piscicida]ELV7537505.1 SoxR-reducing system protein RseC [Edwardsiella piscicida]